MRVVAVITLAALISTSAFAQDLSTRGGNAGYHENPAVVIDTTMVTPIGTARQDSAGSFRAFYLNDTLKVVGVVTTPNLQSAANKTAYCIQDNTGGIYVYCATTPSVNFALGDTVAIIGQIQQYRGLTEIVPWNRDTVDHIVLVHHGSVLPQPKHLTLAQMADINTAEKYESSLVEVDTLVRSSGYWPAAGHYSSIYMNDSARSGSVDNYQSNVLWSQKYPSSDSIQMYIGSSINIPGSADSTKAYPVNVVGVISQFTSSTSIYNNGYELLPRDTADIQSTHLIPVLTIAQARAENNWYPIHATLGDTIAIHGVVTSFNIGGLGGYSSYFVQDATGGVDVYSASLKNFQVGDSIVVVGTVDQYNGLEELVPLDTTAANFGLLKHNAVMPTAKRVDLSAFNVASNAEMYEGQVIELDSLYKTSGTWPGAGGSASIYVSDLARTVNIQLYVNKNSDVPGTAEHLYPVNVIGVVSQYGSDSTGYEVIPLDSTDIWKTPGLPSVATIAQAKVDVNSDGVPDHKVTGDTLMIFGVITTPNLGTTTNYFMQDATGGINVFKSGSPLHFSIGDSVSATGKITQFHGLTEISLLDSAHLVLLKHNAVTPKPKHITLHQYNLNQESYEGTLVEIDTLTKIAGTWASAGTDTLTSYTPSTDTAFVYLNASTSAWHLAEPVYPVNVVGVASQYTVSSSGTVGGYEIVPLDSTSVTTTLPGTPSLIKLSGLTGVRTDTLTLNWHPSGFATKYLFQLSPDKFTTYTVNDSNVADTSKTVLALARSTKYFWRVSAYDAGGYSAFSTVDSFTTVVAAPAAPTLASPVGTTGVPRKATLKWNPAPTAASYHLQVATDSAFTAVVFDTTLADTSKQLSTPLSSVTKYFWRVSASNEGGVSSFSTVESFTTGTGIDAVDELAGIPKDYYINQNYPNPFNPTTTIKYGLPNESRVQIAVYDILGQEVAVLVDGMMTAGNHDVVFNGDRFASGVYFYVMRAGDKVFKQKMLLMK